MAAPTAGPPWTGLPAQLIGRQQGTTTDTPVAVDANGALLQTPANTTKTAITSADGDQATIGITTGAKIITDVAGTLQQYLRGIAFVLGSAYESSGGTLGVQVVPVGGVGPTASTASDALTGALTYEQMAATYAYNGSTFDRMRAPNVFKQASLGAVGTFAIWTPAAGKKFRLLRATLLIPDDLVLATRVTVQLEDGAANIAGFWPIGASASALESGGWFGQTIDYGPVGLLSSTANNVLNAVVGGSNLISACVVIAAGTEE